MAWTPCDVRHHRLHRRGHRGAATSRFKLAADSNRRFQKLDRFPRTARAGGNMRTLQRDQERPRAETPGRPFHTAWRATGWRAGMVPARASWNSAALETAAYRRPSPPRAAAQAPTSQVGNIHAARAEERQVEAEPARGQAQAR